MFDAGIRQFQITGTTKSTYQLRDDNDFDVPAVCHRLCIALRHTLFDAIDTSKSLRSTIIIGRFAVRAYTLQACMKSSTGYVSLILATKSCSGGLLVS